MDGSCGRRAPPGGIMDRMARWRESLDLFFNGDPRRYWRDLRDMSRDQAIARLRAYQREERRLMEPWYMLITAAVIIAGTATFAIYAFGLVTGEWQAPRFWLSWWNLRVLLPLNVVFIVVNAIFSRRLRRRIAARIEEEQSLGHASVCLTCGYDLRATPADARGPECGTSVEKAVGVAAAATAG
jgi:hypothetical protein